eukprot:m.147279 g.147279  ORF g.147279 m.147279 type:complete len:115 (-) comp52727_c0_seq3:112-456(-)
MSGLVRAVRVLCANTPQLTARRLTTGGSAGKGRVITEHVVESGRDSSGSSSFLFDCNINRELGPDATPAEIKKAELLDNLIIVIAAGIIAAGGWLVYSSIQQEQPTQASQPKSA